MVNKKTITTDILFKAGVLILLIILIAKFKSIETTNVSTVYITNQTLIKMLETPTNQEGLFCEITTSSYSIIKGEEVTFTLNDGANTLCHVYGKYNNDPWSYIGPFTTGANGKIARKVSLDTVGTFHVAAICGNCVTTPIQVTVNPINPLPPTPVPPSWNNGDIVAGESGSNNLGQGINSANVPIDMSTISPTGGNCKLKAQIQTDWVYANQNNCIGIQANEGMKFSFSDSTGIIYQRTDPHPVGIGVETECGLIWDGVNQWLFTAEKTLKLPNCQVNLNYDIDVIACECK